MGLDGFTDPRFRRNDPREARTSGGLVIPGKGNDVTNSSSVIHAGRRADGAPDLHEVECTAPRCSAKPDPEAPVPLCGDHLRIAFAYVMLRAENVSDTAPPLPPICEQQHSDGSGHVYFIRKGDLVKIGWSSQPSIRFKTLRPDAVLAIIPGTMQDEHRHHRTFAHLREHGEWFRPEPDLLAFIDGLRAA